MDFQRHTVDEIVRKENNIWTAKQSRASEESGAAVIVRGAGALVVAESNNNSMCRALYASEEFAPACERFCGAAFERAKAAGETIAYRCHADLDCRAVPVEIGGETEFVAIVGRAFTRADDYRAATTRAVGGDWQQFAPGEFFADVLLVASERTLDAAAKQFENATDREKQALLEIAAALGDETNVRREPPEMLREETKIAVADDAAPDEAEQSNEIRQTIEQSQNAARQTPREETAATTTEISGFSRRGAAGETEEIAAWRSLFGSLLDLPYRSACDSILRFLSERYSAESLAWLERGENLLQTVSAIGALRDLGDVQFDVAPDDERLLDAARREAALELKEKDDRSADGGEQRSVWLFPVAVGGEIRCSLVLSESGEKNDAANRKMRRRLARFCRTIAPELEILRLREELQKRGWLERAVNKFNENLRDIDSEDFWLNLTQISAELMRAERCSLLVFDEKTDAFTAKAAIGATADAVRRERETLGARVAAAVMQSGTPAVVRDVGQTGAASAPPDWKYKSKSFISYPINIGARKIGVLNLTERAGGDDYNEFDLDLLRAIVPQLAVLIDRAALKHKAGEFEQLSVTDALTGLLNRRYLEERLAEEIRRSNRHDFPVSFMMIDVDEFKSYNDNFSHPEGDRALKLVAQYLKETLRGADIAARYGGEEFSILLPQTTSAEAAIIAERVRERVNQAQFPNRKVTVSVGVASCSQIVCTPAEIVKAADEALYAAKRKGRNNVQIYENLR